MGYWVAHRSAFSTPGVFGGPIAKASESSLAERDVRLDDSAAALIAIPSSLAIASDTSVPDIVEGGWNWGKLHPKNAVDIAAPCGKPIFAFAEGIVSGLGNPKFWNDGYGGFVELTHKDAAGHIYVTRYNHTQENIAKLDNYILQGQVIALVGRTGNVHGPTGCHVHFEVRGARNPFVR